MSKAARAIIVREDKILVMYRNKQGSEYFTLVGGRVGENETTEQALVREVKEETGLDVTDYKPVFYEKHPAPYNEQYIYLCRVVTNDKVAISDWSEEGALNKIGINFHKPVWAEIASFSRLAFRTPQLQTAILNGLKTGFPTEPIQL